MCVIQGSRTPTNLKQHLQSKYPREFAVVVRSEEQKKYHFTQCSPGSLAPRVNPCVCPVSVLQVEKRVLGCGSNVVDHIYKVKGKFTCNTIYKELLSY